MSEIYYKWF